MSAAPGSSMLMKSRAAPGPFQLTAILLPAGVSAAACREASSAYAYMVDRHSQAATVQTVGLAVIVQSPPIDGHHHDSSFPMKSRVETSMTLEPLRRVINEMRGQGSRHPRVAIVYVAIEPNGSILQRNRRQVDQQNRQRLRQEDRRFGATLQDLIDAALIPTRQQQLNQLERTFHANTTRTEHSLRTREQQLRRRVVQKHEVAVREDELHATQRVPRSGNLPDRVRERRGRIAFPVDRLRVDTQPVAVDDFHVLRREVFRVL